MISALKKYFPILPFITIVITLASVMFALIMHLGNIQFGGMDGSALTNAAWQMYLGYKPYKDFITGVPPLFLMGAKWAFQLFGVYWNSFVVFTAIFSIITFFLQIIILSNLGMGKKWAVLISFATQFLTLIPISWWWYNQITSVVGCLFLSSALLLLKKPNETFSQIAFVLLTALLMLAKPNVAIILLSFTLLGFLSVSDLRSLITKLILYAFILVAIILLINKINVIDLILNYRTAGGRILQLQNITSFFWLNDMWESKQTVKFLAPSLVGLIIMILNIAFFRSSRLSAQNKEGLIYLFLCSIGIITGLIAMATNNDHNIIETPIILFGITAIMIGFQSQIGANIKRIVSVLLLLSFTFLIGEGLNISWGRLRIMSVGPGNFYEKLPLTRISSPLFFNRLNAGPRLMNVLHEIKMIVGENNNNQNNISGIFFGPRIDFSYAAFGLKPPRGLPLWWESFSDSRNTRTKDLIYKFKNNRFRTVVFLLNDYTFIPLEIINYLNSNYDVTNSLYLTIYRAKY